MPKLIDYAGRFMFFEAACFALVRDRGVHHLSRHRVAKVLGTSISTVRRLLSSEADLRNLALTEIGHRRCTTGSRSRPTASSRSTCSPCTSSLRWPPRARRVSWTEW